MSRARAWLLGVLAVVVVLPVVLVGVLRLLLPLAPRYQDDFRAWAARTTGLRVEFRTLGATLSWSGPALSLYDVRVSDPADGQLLLAAREAWAGVSVLGLLRDRQLGVNRIGVRGAELLLERDAGGAWRLQGLPLDELLRRRTPQAIAIAVALRDVRVGYRDAGRPARNLDLVLRTASLDAGPGRFAVRADVTPPARYGRELTAELDVPGGIPPGDALPGDWSAALAGQDLDVVALLEFLAPEHRPLQAARGTAGARLGFAAGALHTVGVTADLRGLRLAGRTTTVDYERLSGEFTWSRSAQGWDATARGLRLARGGRAWPATNLELHHTGGGADQPDGWRIAGQFLRLDDLVPAWHALAEVGEGAGQPVTLPRRLRGDLSNFDVVLTGTPAAPDAWSGKIAFAGFGYADAAGDFALEGLTGVVTAEASQGRLQLASRGVVMELPGWFRNALTADRLVGTLNWRRDATGLVMAGPAIQADTSGIAIRTRFRLDFPAGGASPTIDLGAFASARDVRDVLRFLPLNRFPPATVDWLERAIVAGEVPSATVEFKGPLHAFPYDAGQGVFHVALDLRNTLLDYANNWPRIEGIEGRVTFDGVSLYTEGVQARVGNLRVDGYEVRIPDLRHGLLQVRGRQHLGLDEVLDFLRLTPVADALGPVFAHVSGSGPVDTDLQLDLPVGRPHEYDLRLDVDSGGATVALAGLPFDLTRVQGRVRLHNTRLSGEGIRAVMLQEPVQVRLVPAEADGADYTHVIYATGSTPVQRVADTFHLPTAGAFTGRVGWQSEVAIPARRATGGEPLRVTLRSDLRGVASTLPPPFGKAAETPWNVDSALTFPKDGVIVVDGHQGAAFAWALRLESGAAGWRIERGLVEAGAPRAALPAEPGLALRGGVAEFRLEDWLRAFGGGAGEGRGPADTLRAASFGVGRLSVAGAVFRDAWLDARHEAGTWNVHVESGSAIGDVAVPADPNQPIRLEMGRLWLFESEPATADGRVDPRRVPPLDIRVDDAALGRWHLGGLQAQVARTPDGVLFRPILVRDPGLRLDAEMAWRVDPARPDGQRTSLRGRLESGDVADLLERAGLNPMMSGKGAKLSATLGWPGPPAADFLDDATGELSMEFTKGQVLDIEPGSGRVLGLLSVAAVPRRLLLDFSDVFRKGLAFDRVHGDFHLAGGSAYTCSSGLEGPSADMAVIGRTRLATHEYDQLAVVRPQVSTVLPVVGGAVLGGPVGGVTMLLISQLFRKPLSTLGESYYRITGKWDAPVISRVQRNQLDPAAFKDCERELAATLQALPPEEPETPPTTAAPDAPATP